MLARAEGCGHWRREELLLTGFSGGFQNGMRCSSCLNLVVLLRVGDCPWSLPWELGWRLDLLVHEGNRQGFLFSWKESRVHPGTQCTGSGVEEPGLCPCLHGKLWFAGMHTPVVWETCGPVFSLHVQFGVCCGVGLCRCIQGLCYKRFRIWFQRSSPSLVFLAVKSEL